MFEKILEFEEKISKFTNSPYVVTTDCCTHAIELCLRLKEIKKCKFTAYTYLSIPMTMEKLNIEYELFDEEWIGEYNFYGTNIWDSARRFEPNMYRSGQMQCLSFGYSKPLTIGRGGAILLDDYSDYKKLSAMRYDGRDLSVSPWIDQKEFSLGFHYKLNPEECQKGIELLDNYKKQNNFNPIQVNYPDCREIIIL